MPDDPLRYPIGRFQRPTAFTPDTRRSALADLLALPGDLRRLVEPLSDADLARPYRPGGWSARQVVHHLPDSHVNAYVRTKLALTEDAPLIRVYDEAAWANLPDSSGPVAPSLDLLDSLHRRWAAVLDDLTDADWARSYRYPDRTLSLDVMLAMYTWHGRHHLAHIQQALN